MKIGYPCINRTLRCSSSRTFRLASYSQERLRFCIEENLACLEKVLSYNDQNGLMFFRLSSDLVPFASHPVMDLDWASEYQSQFQNIGRYISRHRMRVSMHPDQFIVLNSKTDDVVERSKKELDYHGEIFRLMGLTAKQKFQLHLGGVYGDKKSAIERFCNVYDTLSEQVKKHLVIENDDRSFSLSDCLKVSKRTNVPVLLDVLHHKCLNEGEPLSDAVLAASDTWRKSDGVPMVDFSNQRITGPKGAHAEKLDSRIFKNFLNEIEGTDCDIMLEIKDKEESACRALGMLRKEREELSRGIFKA